MVDQPGQGEKDNAQGTIFNSDIGDDWGEAFEAEDFMSSAKEEGEGEFFLPDEPSVGKAASPVADAVQPLTAPQSTPERFTLLHSLTARFRQSPLPLRLAVLIIPLLGLAITLVLPRLPKPQAPKPQTLANKGETVHPPAVATPPHPLAPPATAHVVAPQTAAHEAGPPPPPAEPQKLRKKWRFPAIIAYAKAESGTPPIILATDLTLVLKLGPESTPPAEKEPFIRELLYQFYANQPPDDLKRYALERGEMNRKLQAWIMKQWPDLPLDSIAIDRYQLL